MVQIPLSQHPRGNKILCGVKYSAGSQKRIFINGSEYASKKLTILMDPVISVDRFNLIITKDGNLILTQNRQGNIGFAVSPDITLDGTTETPENFIEVNWMRRRNKSVQRYTFYVPLTIFDAE